MIQEIVISPLGWAVIICPECGAASHAKPGPDLQHKILERTCICGAKHQIVFNTRTEPRKKCSLSGILLAEEDVTVDVYDISEKGFYFEGDDLNLNIGSIYKLKIKISEQWIEVLARIVRADKKFAGAEFVHLGLNERKMIGNYLLSN